MGKTLFYLNIHVHIILCYGLCKPEFMQWVEEMFTWGSEELRKPFGEKLNKPMFNKAVT